MKKETISMRTQLLLLMLTLGLLAALCLAGCGDNEAKSEEDAATTSEEDKTTEEPQKDGDAEKSAFKAITETGEMKDATYTHKDTGMSLTLDDVGATSERSRRVEDTLQLLTGSKSTIHKSESLRSGSGRDNIPRPVRGTPDSNVCPPISIIVSCNGLIAVRPPLHGIGSICRGRENIPRPV
jgi:hypothetical protein